jgi:hypothetical protein
MELAGVSPSDIAQVSMPYIASEVLQHYDPKTTAIVFAVSQKDMDEDPRFSFAPTKSGKPGYLQPYKGNENNLQPFGDASKPQGYVIVTPTFDFTVLGKPMRSASELRSQFGEANDEKKKKIVKDLFGNYSEKVYKLMKDKIKAPVKLSQMRNKHNHYVVESVTHDEFQPMLDKFVQFAADHLKLKKVPPIHLKKDKDSIVTSFGGYSPHTKEIVVATKDRHPMDIFRTVAHELTHAKQDEEGHVEKAGDAAGDTGHPLENEANAEAGIILRHWGRKYPDFFKLKYVVENVLNEGINDKSTFKAVFLAGGPGSGKDFIMKKTIEGTGLSEINSDVAFEFLMKQAGLDPKMPDSEEAIRNIVRGTSKEVTKDKQRLALAGRLGVIINGTADDAVEMALLKQGLEAMGYDTMMIFVNTSDEVSRERNIERGQRGGREVKEKIRKQKWDAAQKAKPELEKVFGKENFIEIDNSLDVRNVDADTRKVIEDNWNKAFKQVRKFTAKPVDNIPANAWYAGEMKKKGITPEKYIPPSQSYGTQAPAQPKPVPQNVANFVSTPTPIPIQQTQMPVNQHTSQPINGIMQQASQLGLSYYGFGRYGKEVKGVHVVTHKNANGKLVPVKPAVQQVAEEKKMKNDPCWSGYEMIGKKKKGGREVPNCVPIKENETDRKFQAFAEEHGAGFEGTNQLRNRYMKDTPGETMPGRTAISSPFFEDKKAKLKKKLKKKLNQEDNSLALGYEFGNNGIGDTYGIPRSPSGIGMGYSLPLVAGSISESIRSWANSSKTMQRFSEKYGNLAEQKIIETALKICEWQKEPSEKGLYSGRGDVDEQSPDLMSILPRKSDYTAKFPGVKGNPPVEAQYDKMRAIKHRDAHLYAAEHPPTKMVGPNAPKDKRQLEEEQLNERGADSKGFYRPTEKGAGLTRKGAKHFGIKTAVTTPPSKLNPKGKAAARRRSFCARMGGMRGPMKDEKGRPTRKAMSLRRWNCEE